MHFANQDTNEKCFDVFGLGNALVDLEYQVSEDFLDHEKIEKGVMALSELDEQQSLIKSLDKEKFVKQVGGGSAANSLVALAQIGGKCFYTCRVADDEKGHFFDKDLKKYKITSNVHHKKASGGSTGYCVVMVTPDAERTMRTYLGVTAELSQEDLDEEALKKSKYIYIEGYLLSNPHGKEVVMKALKLADKYGIKKALTFSDPNMVRFFNDAFKEVLSHKIDVIFCNFKEGEIFTGKSEEKEILEALGAYSPLVALTKGASGASAFISRKDEGQEASYFTFKGPEVKAQDTNGAGDMFAGVFLHGLSRNLSLEICLEKAVMASGKLVTQFGARMEQTDLQKLWNEGRR